MIMTMTTATTPTTILTRPRPWPRPQLPPEQPSTGTPSSAVGGSSITAVESVHVRDVSLNEDNSQIAIKLKFLFAAEAELLIGVLSNELLQSSMPNFIDPRGPPPRPGQPLVNVFIN